jgi:arylsulfatase
LNILLLTDDQHRWDFYDDRTVPSLNAPNLRRLMREGATLTHSYSNCPICMPTRFSWMYGLYAGQCSAGLLNNHHDWPRELSSMAHGMQVQGYTTALVGKLHSHAGLRYLDLRARRDETIARGFDHVYEVSGKSLSYWYDCEFTEHLRKKGLLEEYRLDIHLRCRQGVEEGRATFLDVDDTMDTLIGRTAAKWIDEYGGEKPFFLHASFCGPHFPYDPPASFLRRQNPDDMPPPEARPDAAVSAKDRTMRAAYAAMVEHVDSEMGRVFEALERKNWMDDTLIFFTTDHGDMLGHHGHYGKMTPYDTSVRTPVIARFPDGRNAGLTLESMAEAVDLPCTLLEAAGMRPEDIPAHLSQTPGRSWLGYARGERGEHRRDIYSECGTFDRESAFRMIRERDWKYVLTPSGEMLFDTLHDPWETTNLKDRPEQRERIASLRERLLRRMAESVPPNRPGATCRDGDWWIEQPGNAEKADALNAS